MTAFIPFAIACMFALVVLLTFFASVDSGLPDKDSMVLQAILGCLGLVVSLVVTGIFIADRECEVKVVTTVPVPVLYKAERP